MLPLLGQLSIRHGKWHARCWLPVFLLWPLLLPVAVVLAPIACIGLVAARIDPIRATFAVLGVLSALSGTLISIERPGTFIAFRLV